MYCSFRNLNLLRRHSSRVILVAVSSFPLSYALSVNASKFLSENNLHVIEYCYKFSVELSKSFLLPVSLQSKFYV